MESKTEGKKEKKFGMKERRKETTRKEKKERKKVGKEGSPEQEQINRIIKLRL